MAEIPFFKELEVRDSFKTLLVNKPKLDDHTNIYAIFYPLHQIIRNNKFDHDKLIILIDIYLMEIISYRRKDLKAVGCEVIRQLNWTAETCNIPFEDISNFIDIWDTRLRRL